MTTDEQTEERRVPLSLLVSRDQRDALKRIAHERDLSLSDVAREALREFLASKLAAA